MENIKAILAKIRFFLWPYLIVVFCCIVIKFTFTKKEIYFYINGLHFHLGDILFPQITQLGSFSFTIFIVLVFVLFVSYRSAFLIGTAYLFSASINFPLKYIFCAARPYVYFHDLHSHMYFIPGVDILANYYSFPSGHTVCAFSGAVAMTYLCKQKYGGILFLTLALMVGYSRIYMSEHFFEDVFGGSIVGTILTIIWLEIAINFHFLENKNWGKSLLFR